LRRAIASGRSAAAEAVAIDELRDEACGVRRYFAAIGDVPLLAEDVRLDLVNRLRLAGRKDVAVYFGRYGDSSDWKFTPGLAEGRLALLVSNPADRGDTVEYVVFLDWRDGRISGIRDFRHAKYVTDGLVVAPL
jgi:RNA polymerase sigma-70 factor (ECF subfamily)